MANTVNYSRAFYYPYDGGTANLGKQLKVQVYYSKGGMNYFSGNNNPRGIYISCTPVEIEDHGDWKSESFECFTGLKRLLVELPKASAKAFATQVARIAPHYKEIAQEYLENKTINLNF